MPPTIIVVVGGIILDLFISMPQLPAPGEVVLGTSLRRRSGGKGANMAIASYRTSHLNPTHSLAASSSADHGDENDVQVYLNGAVGDDEDGAFLLAAIACNGIDVSQVQVLPGVQSATAVMLVGSDASESAPRIIAFREASKAWRLRERDGVNCMAMGLQPDLVISDLAIFHDEAVHVLAIASQQGIDTMLNPGPAVFLNAAVYRTVTHLVLNGEEAAVLSSRKLEDLQKAEGWTEAAEYFLGWGVGNVVLTLGDRGAYYAGSGGERGIVEAERDVERVDSTGAGYVFYQNLFPPKLTMSPACPSTTLPSRCI